MCATGPKYCPPAQMFFLTIWGMFEDEFIVGHILNTSNENLYISISTFVPRRDIQLSKIQQYRENLQ